MEQVSYIATSEVTALEHEVRDDTVEGRSLVAEALFAGAESTEVLSSLRHNIIKEVEGDSALLIYRFEGITVSGN